MLERYLILFAALWFSRVASVDIHLNKCCREHWHYDLGNNKCDNETESITKEIWPPPFVPFTPANLTLRKFTKCPDEFIIQSTKDFKVNNNGTLSVGGSEQELEAGSFCINSAISQNSSSRAEWAARFCLPDPCKTKTCVRKCCPEGWRMNMEQSKCEKSDHKFDPQFKNISDHSVAISPENYVIRSGNLPECSGDLIFLNPTESPEDKFLILSTGNLFVPSFPKDPVVCNYCVEDFMIDDYMGRMALVCELFPPMPGEVATKMEYLSYLMFFSAAFLWATFLVYSIIPELRNIHGVTVMCHSASLATMFICFGIIQLHTKNLSTKVCVALAIATHFSFLSAFTWLNVMSFDIWWTLTGFRPRSMAVHRHVNRLGNRFIYYSLYAWGVPFLIVLTGQILDNIQESTGSATTLTEGKCASNLDSRKSSSLVRPRFGVLKCWFIDVTAVLTYLHGPIAVILLANMIFFLMTSCWLYRMRKATASATKNRKKQNFVVISSVFLLMGVTWISEIITVFIDDSNLYSIPTDVLNILTGVFIFIIFICKKNVRVLLWKKCSPIERFIRRGQFNVSFSQETGGATAPRSTEISKTKESIPLSKFSTSEKNLDEIDLSK